MQVDISIEKSHHFKLTHALLVYRSNLEGVSEDLIYG